MREKIHAKRFVALALDRREFGRVSSQMTARIEAMTNSRARREGATVVSAISST
jgi:hypothetical protein